MSRAPSVKRYMYHAESGPQMTERTRHIAALTAILTSALFPSNAVFAEKRPIVLESTAWRIQIDPGTLAFFGVPNGLDGVWISAGQQAVPIAEVERGKDRAAWKHPGSGLAFRAELKDDEFVFVILASGPSSFTWPVVTSGQGATGLIWPRREGCFVPFNDSQWIDYLVSYGDWDTLEGVGMPFWGIYRPAYTITYIVTNPYNNSIRFHRDGGRVRLSFQHEFMDNRSSRECRFVVSLSRGDDPVAPARRFRKWLKERGEFVGMDRKARITPKVRRLLGAPHAYLWGDGLFTRHDVPARKWKPFCQELIRQARGGGPSPGKRIKRLLDPRRWTEVEKLAGLKWPYDYIKNQVAEALSGLLERQDFYEPESWSGITLPGGARELLSRGQKTLSKEQLCFLNAHLLRAAYPEFTAEVDEWGDGVSVKMLRVLRSAGLDRVRLCLGGWRGAMRRPEVARKADELGYLFGTYDSYHSVHNPSLKGTDASWETAQFDRQLYETGAVVRRNGKKVRGFKKRGYRLSPIIARPYVERRVNRVLAAVPFNYYFIDCDAYGEVCDDYSPLHPATQADSVQARNDRMAWIRDQHRLVIGSEGGSSYAAPVIHVAEGIVTPAFGWGDPDLKNKKSKYYLGAWYPPDGPDVFLKQVPIKEKYRRSTLFRPAFPAPALRDRFPRLGRLHAPLVGGQVQVFRSRRYHYADGAALHGAAFVPPEYEVVQTAPRRNHETLRLLFALAQGAGILADDGL